MALTGGQNQCEIWYGFAKRGLGLSADQGSPFSRTDGTEAFDLPAACAYLGATPPTQNICPGDSADYIVEVGQLFSARCLWRPITSRPKPRRPLTRTR
jgi:hypothetical protein